MNRAVTLIGLGAGVFGLGVQFILTIKSRVASGDNLLVAFIYFVSFFTMLTNFVLILIYASALFKDARLDWFRRDTARAMMAGLITLVMVFYHFLLNEVWDPQGWYTVCDIVLHYVTPAIYLVWWVYVPKHGNVRFSDIPMMCLPAVIYLACIMIRGAVTDIYPYPVLEAYRLGYGAVAINIMAMLLFTGGLYAAVVLADKRLAGRRTKMA